MIMIGIFVQAIIDYGSRYGMPVLSRYYNSLDPSDREEWFKSFSRSLFARAMYLTLKLPVPPEIEQANDDMELVEQFKSEWEAIFNKIFPVGIDGLNTEEVKTSLLRELVGERPNCVGQDGSSSETDADSDEEESLQLNVSICSSDDIDTFKDLIAYVINFNGKQHIERFADYMLVDAHSVVRDLPGSSCPGCTFHKTNCVCETCEVCDYINPKGMRHLFCAPQCSKKEQYEQGQIHYSDN